MPYKTSIKKYKWSYLLAVFVFLISSIPSVSIFAQTATLSVTFVTDPLGGGGAPLTGLTMIANVSGTATGPINYYFYCNAANDDSTTVIPGYAHSIIGTNSTDDVPTPAGICDSVYATIGTYLAKVIVERGGLAREERRTFQVFNPAPQVNLQIRLLGATTWSDPSTNVPYNSEVEIRWTFFGASSCTMSGDWTGTKTAPGQESVGNLTEGRTYYFTLECITSSGLLTDTVWANVEPPTLFSSLLASPNSGTAPLVGVILRADVTGGTAIGTINYTFYCNRSDTGTNITSGWAYKLDGTNLLTLSAPNNACNSVYANSGTYTAKVIIERGGVTREVRVPVTVNSPPAPVIDLTADSGDIGYNGSTTLRWTVSNATTCTPSLGPTSWTSSGNKTVPTGNWPTSNLTGPLNYTYRLTCVGPGGTTSDSITIAVAGPPPPPAVNIWANEFDGPITVAYGTNVLLRWETGYYGADSCEGWSDFSSWSGSKNPGGSQEYTENLFGPEQYTFIITCYDSANQSGSDRVIVNVLAEPPTIDYFWAGSPNINYNTATELSWFATNDIAGTNTVCAITGGLSRTGLPAEGSISTGNLTATQNYTLTCANSGGPATRSLTVTVEGVPAPTLNLQANTTSINYGGSVTLTWNSTNATSCEASSDLSSWDGTKLADGSQTIYNLTADESFSLTCTGAGGTTAPRNVNINVGVPPRATVNVTAKSAREDNYSDSDITVDCRTAVDIRWEVTGAVGCWTLGDWTEREVSANGGTYRTQNLIEGEYYYEVFCENPDQAMEEDSISVTVRECTGNEPIVFTNPIEQGDLGGILDSLSGLIKMIAIGLAGIMIIVSGIIILTSIDDRERLNKGKRMLKWSLIGLAIALASSFIIGFIEELVN